MCANILWKTALASNSIFLFMATATMSLTTQWLLGKKLYLEAKGDGD